MHHDDHLSRHLALALHPRGSWPIRDVARVLTTIARQKATAEAGADCIPSSPGAALERDTPISGRYRSSGSAWLELRLDVDGRAPTLCLSGDFFESRGQTVIYSSSFIARNVSVRIVGESAVMEGTAESSLDRRSPIKVTVALPTAIVSPLLARVEFAGTGLFSSTTYDCAFVSPYFRTVELEQDFVTDITPLGSYDTGRLSSPEPHRDLSVVTAFAEAGIEVLSTGSNSVVPIELAGADKTWSRSELHAAMERHFSSFKDRTRINEPAWRIWLLVANRCEQGNRGMMFDNIGRHRQGCAVFHDAISGTTDEALRGQLRTYVHELGHCFNLYHSFIKSYMRPPERDRPDALSWMNYPDSYKSGQSTGAAAYWSAFPFEFDRQEIVHLRHSFRNSIIMGGADFSVGAADSAQVRYPEIVEDRTGLKIEIRARRTYLLGEPVVVEIKLSCLWHDGNEVNGRIHPNQGFVEIGITGPGGEFRVYRPYIRSCADTVPVELNAKNPAVYDSAYIGFGGDGFYFASPGHYHLRAVYSAEGGAYISSNQLVIRIRPPLDRIEDEWAELYLDEDRGTLLYLLGSDLPALDAGTNGLREAVEKYPAHPLAVYARLVLGMNAARDFKNVLDNERRVETRVRQERAAVEHLSKLLETAETLAAPDGQIPKIGVSLDNISLNMAVRRLAKVQRDQGDLEGSRQCLAKARQHFDKGGVPAHVRHLIDKQFAEIVPDLPPRTAPLP